MTGYRTFSIVTEESGSSAELTNVLGPPSPPAMAIADGNRISWSESRRHSRELTIWHTGALFDSLALSTPLRAAQFEHRLEYAGIPISLRQTPHRQRTGSRRA